MMNSALPLLNMQLVSSRTFESTEFPGVTFTIRKMTLRQRIDLLSELYGLYREFDYSSAGTSRADQLNALLNSLRIDEVFVRWGVISVDGLVVDGKPVAPNELVEYAPEGLTGEILVRIRECIAVSPDEEKN